MRDPDIDVVHICTPNHLHLPLAEAALAAGKHVICEKPLALDAAGAQQLVDAAADSGSRRQCRSSTGTTPRCARRASGSAAGRPVPLRLLHGTYLQDWLLRSDDDNWRVDERSGRRLARLRRHRLALVRPRRVRLRPSHRPPLRADAHRGARALERGGTQGVRVRRRRGRRAAGHDRGCCPRPVRDGRRSDRLGGRQPDLGRPQEPALDRARRRRGGARLRPGAAGGALVRAPRGPGDRSPRSRDAVARRPRALHSFPPVIPRATRTASTRSSPTSTTAFATARR